MKIYTAAIYLFFLMLISCNDNISQWQGPDRSGDYKQKGLLKEWPENGPEEIVTIKDIGKGYSQPVLYKDTIYVTGIKEDTMDVISAYSIDGKLLWEKEYSRAWKGSYPDSRGTPTIEKNRIYLVGGMGALVCLNAKNGDILWNHNPNNDYHGEYKGWGIVESVLLTYDAVLYTTGGKETTLVAFNKRTGKLRWKSESAGGKKSYASSSLVEYKGLKIALVQTTNDLIGFDVKNGKILWTYNTLQYHVKKGAGEATNTPLFHDGEIFVTYGNDQPGLMFKLSEDGKSIHLKWKNTILDTHHGGLVLVDGVIYGSTMQHNTQGSWAAVDWVTGKTYWEKEWITKGSIITADGMLYLYEERSGNVALVKPDIHDLKIVSTFQIKEGRGPYWSHPSIYDGMLMLRHGEVLKIFNIRED